MEPGWEIACILEVSNNKHLVQRSEENDCGSSGEVANGYSSSKLRVIGFHHISA